MDNFKNLAFQKKFVYNVLKKFDKLNDESTNTFHDNFETSCRDTAEDIILINKKLKKRLIWENPDIFIKSDNLKPAAQLKNSCSTRENINSYMIQKMLYDT